MKVALFKVVRVLQDLDREHMHVVPAMLSPNYATSGCGVARPKGFDA